MSEEENVQNTNVEENNDVTQNKEESAEITRPDDLPEELWNTETKEINSPKLYEAYKKGNKRITDLTKKLSQGYNKVPESIDGYELDFKDIESKINKKIDAEDLGIKTFKNVAHKHGLTKEQFQNIFSDYVQEMSTPKGKKMSDEEVKQSDADFSKEERKKLGEDANTIIGGIESWGDALKKDNVLSNEEVITFNSLAYDAESMKLVSKLKNLYAPEAEKGIPGTSQNMDQTGLLSAKELDEALKSEHYHNYGPDFHKVKRHLELEERLAQKNKRY